MFIRLVISSLVAGLLVSVSAQEDAVTVDVTPVEQKEMLALWVTDVVEGMHPIVLVRSVKVQLKEGTPVREQPSKDDLLEFRSLLRDKSVYFRVLRGDEGVGIFKYRTVPRSERPDGRGTWLQALPLDRDDTFLDMTRDARESADIEALLEMDVEEAERATRREELLDRKIAQAIEREWEMLQSGHAFLVPTRPAPRSE